VDACVYLLIAQEWINQFAQYLAYILHECRKRFQKGKNSKKLYWVSVPVRVVAVAWVLNMHEGKSESKVTCRCSQHDLPLDVFTSLEAQNS
jgi:hypothetical protein